MQPWYVGWSVCHETVLGNLSRLVTRPRFLSRYDMIGNMWIFIGTPGYGAHLHLDDDLDTNTWQVEMNKIKKNIWTTLKNICRPKSVARRPGSWSLPPSVRACARAGCRGTSTRAT